MLALAALGAGAPAAAAQAPPSPNAEAWLLVDASDGDRLAAHAASERRSVASATKLMTAYVALRELRLRERVVAPRYVASGPESLLGLEAGESVTAHDLLYGLLLASGNDAAAALAEGVSRSTPEFVARMNREAQRLGLDGTSYANPIGFDDPANYSTAQDLVDLTLRLRREAAFRRIVDTARITLDDGAEVRTIENRNNLVAAEPWVNGVKTGFTLDAGYVLVGSGTRKGVTLVSALLGAPSEAERDAGTLELLRHGFSLYDRRTVLRRGERVARAALRFRDGALPLVAARDVRLVVRRDERVKTRVVESPAEIDAAERGERLGTVAVRVDGEEVERVPLVAARSVEPASAGDRLDSALPGSRAAAWAILGGIALLALVAVVALVRARRRPTG